MKEIREIFETVRTYCGMMFGENRAAKSVTGKMYCHALLSEGEKVAVRAERVTDTREGLSQISSLHNSPLSRISNAHSSSQRTATSSLGEVSSTTQQQPLSVVIPSLIRRVRSGCGKLGGLQDFSATTETRLTRMRNFSGIQPIKIERLVAYPSKSSLTREDLCYGKVALDNNPNSSETDHASMPLGIFASKSVSHKANVGGVGTPPYVAKSVSLSDWQIRPTALKRAAFTLAEVLITLGIIGVVAALTLPTLIQNHQKQVYVTQLKKSYSAMNNAINKMAADEGVVDWSQTLCASLTYDDRTGGNVSRVNECFDGLAKQMNAIKTKQWMQICNEDWCSINHVSSSGEDYIFATSDGATYVFPCAIFPFYYVDVNGTAKGPNQDGRDIFGFDAEGSNSAENFTYIGANKLTPNGAHSWSPNAWKNCSATNLSTDCTAKVLIEGKMNY